jgi:DNA-binding transcriptional ArsR family regulator
VLDIIVSSKTRIKLLIKFFLFEDTVGYLRSMEREFHESSNSIRVELNKFVRAGLLTSERKGKRRYYRANPGHPLYNELKRIVHKTVGIDQILDKVISKIGNLEAAFITGGFANGIDSDTIELALVGQNLDTVFISRCVKVAEKFIHRRIMYLLYTPDQMAYFFQNKSHLLIWKADSKPESFFHAEVPDKKLSGKF